MSKAPKKGTKQGIARQAVTNLPSPADFDEVLGLIDAARTRAVAAVNTTLIELYWSIGEYISRKIESAAWGEGVVEQLAVHIARTHPGLRGYTRANLFRMRQFYETYGGDEKVAALLRQLPWTHNLLILAKSKRAEEREFYLRMATTEQWSSRELERQISPRYESATPLPILGRRSWAFFFPTLTSSTSRPAGRISPSMRRTAAGCAVLIVAESFPAFFSSYVQYVPPRRNTPQLQCTRRDRQASLTRVLNHSNSELGDVGIQLGINRLVHGLFRDFRLSSQCRIALRVDPILLLRRYVTRSAVCCVAVGNLLGPIVSFKQAPSPAVAPEFVLWKPPLRILDHHEPDFDVRTVGRLSCSELRVAGRADLFD